MIGHTASYINRSGLPSRSIGGRREGNIWAATMNGLDRFRDLAIPTISVKQGLSNATTLSVLAARDGSLWLGTIDGLNRWNEGQITTYHKQSGLPGDGVESLFQDDEGRIWVSTHGGIAYFEKGRFVPVNGVPAGVVHSIAGDSAGNLWIGDQNQGLFHLLQGRVVERIPWVMLGHGDYAQDMLFDRARGGLWLGFYQGGLAYFKDGELRASYAAADGLGEGRVNDLQLDRDGTLWAATDNGLSRVKKDAHVATLTAKNGLPCDAVHLIMEDDAQSVWLFMSCGWRELTGPN